MRYLLFIPPALGVVVVVLTAVLVYLARTNYLLKVDLTKVSDDITDALHHLAPKRQLPSIPIPTVPIQPVGFITSAVRSEATALAGHLNSAVESAVSEIAQNSKLTVFYNCYETPAGTFRGSFEPLQSLDIDNLDVIPDSSNLESILRSVQEAGNLANPRNLQILAYDMPVYALTAAIVASVLAFVLAWAGRSTIRWIIVCTAIVLAISIFLGLLITVIILLTISHYNPFPSIGDVTAQKDLSVTMVFGAFVALVLALSFWIDHHIRIGPSAVDRDDANDIGQIVEGDPH